MSSEGTMRVRVLFFGRLREIAGKAEETVELPVGSPIEDLFSAVAARQPAVAAFRSSLVASRNLEFAPWTTRLQAGDEIAFLPPVSGG